MWVARDLGLASDFTGYSGFLHYLQLASHEFVTIWHKCYEKTNSKFYFFLSGGIARRIHAYHHVKDNNGNKQIVLKTARKDIKLDAGHMGKVKCWKLHKPMRRVLGHDVIHMKRPCLRCARNQYQKYSNVFY